MVLRGGLTAVVAVGSKVFMPIGMVPKVLRGLAFLVMRAIPARHSPRELQRHEHQKKDR